MNARKRNYIFVRDRRDDELEWVRAEKFEDDDLPRPVGVINGCFDLFHSGHAKLIFQAREHCKTLICALDSDRRIKESKGSGRPIMSWIERATMLGYMPLDYLVEIDSDVEMRDFLNKVRPDFRVQGAEYREHHTKYPWLKKLFVRSEGMRTSEIIRRIRGEE